jgi:hypothetical protein
MSNFSTVSGKYPLHKSDSINLAFKFPLKIKLTFPEENNKRLSTNGVN